MSVRKTGRGCPRRGSGWPKGSGKPAPEVRRNRLVVMLTDAELAALNAWAREGALPAGTAAYEVPERALRRRS